MTPGNDLIAVAAMNNTLQGEAVLSAAGSTGRFTETFWTNDHYFDVPYANGATLGSPLHSESHLADVERLTASRPPEVPTHVMDSWAALDLAPLGYRVLIADEWFVGDRPPERTAPPPGGIEIVKSAAGLAEFEAASVVGFGGVAPQAVGHTYPATLLADERFSFYGLRVDGVLATGVFLFRDPGCTGVFTFFTLPDCRGRGLGTALLRHVLSQAPGLPLATNPSPMSRGIFTKLGFRAIGERRIWAR